MRHSTDKYTEPCNCRSVGECFCNFGAERKAIEACVDEFAAALKAKLLSKMRRGSAGWDDPAWPREQVIKQLIEHVTKGDMVDVAALAMFAWNQAGPPNHGDFHPHA